MTDVKAAISAYEEVAAAVDTLVDALQERDRIRNEPESVLTLGIETSCDETAVSVLAGAHDIRSNIISTSAEMHRKFGGVVPEIASRAQVQSINPAIDAGDIPAAAACGGGECMSTRTTATSGILDQGNLDLGFHYPVCP